ncbi:hypothetical protein ILUMI_12982 [Ignelater luminosus]|uniref:Uncharacterized protein n=1 Tax=Ignelater luminosus TaxID=2038154 RepID=A0A8K0CXK1_IGNLU|nr:hypothetical protein ILUMI_12982 [Ignelater luminosus]
MDAKEESRLLQLMDENYSASSSNNGIDRPTPGVEHDSKITGSIDNSIINDNEKGDWCDYITDIPGFHFDADLAGEILKPKLVTNAKQELVKKSEKIESYYNKTAHDRPSYKPGDDVVVQNLHDKTWSPAKVVCAAGPRSFTVQKESDDMLCRNTFHLRHSLNKCNVSPDFSDTGNEVPKEKENVIFEENLEGNTGQELVSGQDTTKHSKQVARSGRIVKMPTYLKDYY